MLFVGADPDDEDELNPSKVLAHGKSNLGRIAPSVGFRLVETVVEGEDEDGNETGVTTSAVEWLGDPRSPPNNWSRVGDRVGPR